MWFSCAVGPEIAKHLSRFTVKERSKTPLPGPYSLVRSVIVIIALATEAAAHPPFLCELVHRYGNMVRVENMSLQHYVFSRTTKINRNIS